MAESRLAADPRAAVLLQPAPMSIQALGLEAQDLVRRVLAFIATTHELDGEFETRMGIERCELAEVIMRWPHIDDRADDAPATLAINNALNEVANGLDLSADDWRSLGASRAEVQQVYEQWATNRGWPSIGIR